MHLNGAKRTIATLTAIAALKFSGQATAQETPEASYNVRTTGESSLFCTNDGHLAKLKGVSVTKVDYSELATAIARLQLNNPDKNIAAAARIKTAPLPPYNRLAYEFQSYSKNDLTSSPVPLSVQKTTDRITDMWVKAVANKPQTPVKQDAVFWRILTIVSDKPHKACGNFGDIKQAVMRNTEEQDVPFKAPTTYYF